MSGRQPIGFVDPDDFPPIAVHESCDGVSASIADREGIPIYEGSPDAGRHRCDLCGKRIGRRPPPPRVSNHRR